MIRSFVEIAAVVSLSAMVLVVCLQVFARFALPSAPAWTEELSRIFFVYSVAFGIGVAVDREELVRISMVENYLSPGAQQRLQRLIQVVVIAISLLIGLYALPFVDIGHEELSPVLGIRMSVAFASTVVAMVIVAGFTMLKVFGNQRKEETAE